MAATAKKAGAKKRNVMNNVTLTLWDPNAGFRKKRGEGVTKRTIGKVVPLHRPVMKSSEMMLPAFYDFWRESRRNRHLFYVLKGGRNSSKSTHIAIDLIFDIMQYPITALVLRKVERTMKDSVFEQIKWAAEYMGVSHLFRFNLSPLGITYKPRGNKILFRGADKPEKIKSIKASKFPIARGWFEELAEFKTEDEVSTIVNSIIRAELPEIVENGKTIKLGYKIYFSYNPPKRKANWVNKKYETHNPAENMFIHHSTYLDNPHVSEAFIEEAERVKTENPMKYRWDYMGEAIGAGIVPFTNLTFREITDDEIRAFDNIRQGLDWGYGADPLAFLRMHYDKTRRRLYLLDEYYAVKTSNRAISDWLKAKGYTDTWIIADSAEPKSIDELRQNGIAKIRGAKKGPGSIEHGEKWLDDLDEIVIDARRTPNAAKEYENIDYKTDADGNVRNELEDKDNHTIDCTRYGCEEDMRGSRTAKAVGSIM